jgi:uncharacterized protein (TIGR03437 family)
MFSRIGIFLLMIAAAAHGQNARLSAPDQTLSPGQTVIASLGFASAGQSIAAIQFDLEWEPPLRLRVTTGEQIRAASKIPYAVSPTVQKLRCLVAGMNQTALADGELLKLFLSEDPGNSTLSSMQVRITNMTATDSSGSVIRVDAAPIDVQLQNGIPSQFFPSGGVLNAASLFPAPLSPGEIITLLGMNVSSPAVQIGGTKAPVLYAGVDQINVIVPFGLDVPSATLEVSGAERKITMSLPVAAAAPAIFTANGTGVGPGAILNEDYSPNSFDNPAQPGSYIMIYGTGFGTMQSPVTDGQPVTAANPTTLPVTAYVGGQPAEVLYAGAAPGLIAGVTQINVRLPAGLARNLNEPLSLSVAGLPAVQGVTVAIR